MNAPAEILAEQREIIFPAHFNAAEPIFLPLHHGERILRLGENSCVTIIEEVMRPENNEPTSSRGRETFGRDDPKQNQSGLPRSTKNVELAMTAVTKIHLEKNAQLHWIQYQHLPKNISHAADYQITQDQNSKFEAGFFSIGGHVSKVTLHITQRGTHAESFLYGLSKPNRDGQTITHHVQVDHQAPHGNSHMLYKGVLDNKSISAFRGKVVVHKNADKINASQANHHLLLCAGAEAKSQPELEIDAEDVKCTHGSTVGQLDQDALFYLQARGISLHDAKKLLTDAFAEEIFMQIHSAPIQNWLRQRVYAHE
ncbi:MAG: SufD family Fe-S cluster assembly protein [Gammaproteobacteria bacterium]|nr:SufD family Fe-S cluster assembly protein [Gammaproteobacteria bacterium]